MTYQGTPSQTVGPYFSIGMKWLYRSDLTPGAGEAEPVQIRGRVLDADGLAVPDACLEIWQADANGAYPSHESMGAAPSSEVFWGFGRVATNDQGEFHFTTIVPGCVPGPGERLQAPHLEISVFLRGLLHRLITRMYFPGRAENEGDPVLQLVPAERRATLVARKGVNGSGVLEWDVHLQGLHETVFFDY